MPIDENARPFFQEMRMLSKDEQGREILIGLTFEESEWYLLHCYKQVSEIETETGIAAYHENQAIYLYLHEKHEAARLQILNGEYEASRDPRRQ